MSQNPNNEKVFSVNEEKTEKTMQKGLAKFLEQAETSGQVSHLQEIEYNLTPIEALQEQDAAVRELCRVYNIDHAKHYVQRATLMRYEALSNGDCFRKVCGDHLEDIWCKDSPDIARNIKIGYTQAVNQMEVVEFVPQLRAT